MSLLTRIGLSDLVSRTRRERATFFFLVAVSTFLFMDQNLMAPNLTAIGEELVVSREATLDRLEREDAEFRALGQRTHTSMDAKRIAGVLAELRRELVAKDPTLLKDPVRLDGALINGGRVRPDELQLLTSAATALREREQRITAAVQKQVDDELAGRASIWFWMLGGIVAVAVGYVTDKWSRKKLLFGTILIGALPCLFTGFARTVDEFVLLRALTGIGIGAVLPLTYSLVGDLFSAKGRPGAAAWVGLAMGVGIAGGQLLAGILGPTHGWRLPFILVATPNLVIAFLFLIFGTEPKRGAGEEALAEAIEGGAEYTEKIRLGDFKKLFANRTNLLVFAQGIPGSMPWGFFFTFLVDFYHSNKGFSVQDATLLVTVFGAAAILGSFVGGLVGGKLFRKHPKYLPMLCAVAVFLGIPPILAIVNWSAAPDSELQQALQTFAGVAAASPSILGPVLLGIIGAFVATVPASNVKAVLIDVNPPENRGTIFSLFNLADDLGKGLAPFLIGSVLAVQFGRVLSYNISILMWLICGVAWLAMIRVFPRDVHALERSMAARASELRGPPAAPGAGAAASGPKVAVGH